MSSKKKEHPSALPKSKVIRARVDHVTIGKLNACTSKLDTTRSNIIRQGIEQIYDALHN
ncbi:CopG family transcriptional regulator [Paenibacillus sp. RS8]|uniref:CopG family transcriptional regulator n=1 Tax=Paenibacillus sp. RS8 TaxID=3242681 RepID=UPI0035C205B6